MFRQSKKINIILFVLMCIWLLGREKFYAHNQWTWIWLKKKSQEKLRKRWLLNSFCEIWLHTEVHTVSLKHYLFMFHYILHPRLASHWPSSVMEQIQAVSLLFLSINWATPKNIYFEIVPRKTPELAFIGLASTTCNIPKFCSVIGRVWCSDWSVGVLCPNRWSHPNRMHLD